MAFEAELRFKQSEPLNFSVHSAVGLEKGAVVELLDEMACSGATTSGAVVAGIVAREKVASDGRNEVAVYRDGIFDMIASGAIALGAAVASAGYNHVIQAAATLSGASILGHSLATASDDERVLIQLRVGSGGNHVS